MYNFQSLFCYTSQGLYMLCFETTGWRHDCGVATYDGR
jgi:hypothetical protein